MAKKTGKLTRADLDSIIDGMSARDVFRASGGSDDPDTGNQKAEQIFDLSAERQGWGKMALDRVVLGDVTYLGTLLGEALNVGGPKADSTNQSPTSADTGDSVQS